MIEAENIHKSYLQSGARLHILKGIDLKVRQGGFVSLTGPSGAGKSTLLHILGGLDRPSSGNVLFNGRDIYKLSDGELSCLRNSRIGFVFQFYHLLPEFTVLENVMIPAMIKGGVDPEIKLRAEKLIEEVGLGGRLKHFPSQLSGGEQQRVAIARALMNSPSLLLCDEPTGNLDSASGGTVIKILKEVNSRRGTTVLLVTHNKEIASCAQELLYLKDGVLNSGSAV